MITTNRALCAKFIQQHPRLDFKPIKDYSGRGWMYKTDTRCAFANFVDYMHRAGQISDGLAPSAHLTPST
jgi:hypothetical protein